MKYFNIFVAVALIATARANPSGYGSPSAASDYAQASADQAAASAGTSSPSSSLSSSSSSGNSFSSQSIPYTPQDVRGNKVTSSISYPQNKGEILIHRPAAIIVKRPPTKVLVNHPPLVVRPAPVVLHKPPAVVIRKVLVKHHPRPVKVEPVYVNVVKSPAEKYYVQEKTPISSPPSNYSPLNSPSFAVDSAAAANGYQLLQSGQNIADIASAGGVNYGASAPYGQSPAPAPYAQAQASAPYGPASYGTGQAY